MAMQCAVTADLNRHLAQQDRDDAEQEAMDAFVEARAEELMDKPDVVALIAADIWNESTDSLFFAVLQGKPEMLPIARRLLRERFLAEARKLAETEWNTMEREAA